MNPFASVIMPNDENQLIECVPNFSEGRDMAKIKEITDEIEKAEGVRLLNVDPGKATNRTVVTFVGRPSAVIQAAYSAIKKASEILDMSTHKGEHPRMGVTDVCPLIPIANITMEQTSVFANILGEIVGNDLGIPVYMYESSAKTPERKNLATIRADEYEGFSKKIGNSEWKPDYGPQIMNIKSGTTAIGARDFLVAYNVNINTTSVKRANAIAFDIRENGRVKNDPKTNKPLLDTDGNAIRIPGKCKSVKAIGWFIDEYEIAQISMNLTDINATPLHIAFDACCDSAHQRGMRVTGSELVGLVPKSVLVDAGKYFLEKQNRSIGVAEDELIHIAVRTLGLDELSPFDPKTRVIEYLLKERNEDKLVDKTLVKFANETASESPAPGGGSISAYVGTMGIALGTMVANLSAAKNGWEKQFSYFSQKAWEGQQLKDHLLDLVDADTLAFNKIMDATRLPKITVEDNTARDKAISEATINAIEVPLKVMRTSYLAMELIAAMASKGNPNSVSDAGVGALCMRTAVEGAYLNVLINCKDFDDTAYVTQATKEANQLLADAKTKEEAILQTVRIIISGGQSI